MVGTSRPILSGIIDKFDEICLKPNQMKNILFLLFSLFLLTSCSKTYQTSSTIPPQWDFQLTAESMTLLDKQWSEVAIKVIEDEPLSEEDKDITHQIYATDLDDLMIFRENGTYQFDEGRSKAVATGSQVYEDGYWQLKDNQLVLMAHGAETLYLVEKLSADSLVLKLPVAGEAYHYLITYVALEP